jgi:hypothetical protein
MNNNIHILPTDKPSRLHLWVNDKGLQATLYDEPQLEVPNTGINIYITSDEEVTSSCWAFNVVTNTLYKTYGGKGFNEKDEKNDWRKVILTTEELLIKDGVQAIDDQFLEWFVKNPKCEKVVTMKVPFHDESGYSYLLGIPPKEETKQESLEEAAEKHWKMQYIMALDESIKPYIIEDFIAGAKWQAERMYSEEDMNKYGEYCASHVLKSQIGHPYLSVTEWFEQNKNK